MPEYSCLDKTTGKPRLLAEQCADCIGLPGNPMKLRPGRVRKMVNEGMAGGGIICHRTLPYSKPAEYDQPAFCRWFYDKFGFRTNLFRIYERLGGFTEVRPHA